MDESPKLLYTQVIAKDGEDLFYSRLDTFPPSLEELQTLKLDFKKIPPEHVWQPLQDNIITFNNSNKPKIFYIKTPSFGSYDKTTKLSSNLLREANVSKVLMENSHPNIASYLGCIGEVGLIKGLCYERYAETLDQRKQRGGFIDKVSCKRQLEAGITHLHSLSYIHNDLHGGNILFKDFESNDLVITDFDSCVRQGEVLPVKHGAGDATTAEFENDELALKAILAQI